MAKGHVQIKITPVMKSVMIMTLLFGSPPFLMPHTSCLPLMVSAGWLKYVNGMLVLTSTGVPVAKKILREVNKDYKSGNVFNPQNI